MVKVCHTTQLKRKESRYYDVFKKIAREHENISIFIISSHELYLILDISLLIGFYYQNSTRHVDHKFLNIAFMLKLNRPYNYIDLTALTLNLFGKLRMMTQLMMKVDLSSFLIVFFWVFQIIYALHSWVLSLTHQHYSNQKLLALTSKDDSPPLKFIIKIEI